MAPGREGALPKEEVSWGENHREDGGAPACKDSSAAYRRLRLLGQGSFGKAFLARDLETNDLCVMKQVRVERMDAKARDTAVREAVALKRVRHPNVVRFRQVFVRSGWLCLVMDFADGGDLCAAVKERARSKVPFEESAVLECFSQVADAVSWIHSLKMVHRDIKSRNIFLCRTGRALLGDFGLVRILETTCELAKTCVGTPYYLSPEIIRKQLYNYKTDIWSLGVLLYEMAGLCRPFVGTLETLPKAILKGEYEPLGSHYSQELRDLVAGMLQVDPLQRLDLPLALQQEVLRGPLCRSKEALGLEEPQNLDLPRVKREERKRVEEHKDLSPPVAPKPVSKAFDPDEMIGYNTMVRRAGAPSMPSGGAAAAGADAPSAFAQRFANASLAGSILATRGPEGWSSAPQADPESGNEDLDSEASDDSWGSVVDTGDRLLQEVNKANP
jgi:serine/threonine protein kinase